MKKIDILNSGFVIAQDDDNDWDESGYVVVANVETDQAAIGNYNHCSCYGTWDEGHPTWNWEGTISELIHIAENKLDPDMTTRTASSSDSDYDHLMEVYSQVIEWRDSSQPRVVSNL